MIFPIGNRTLDTPLKGISETDKRIVNCQCGTITHSKCIENLTNHLFDDFKRNNEEIIYKCIFCTNKTSETKKVRIVNRANVKTNKNANIQRENYPINAIPKITQGLNHNYAQHIISTTNENDINTKKYFTAKKPLVCEF